jgi:hypothetical protein
VVWLLQLLSLRAVLLLPRRITSHAWRWFSLVYLSARMLNMFKLRHLPLTTKWSRYRQGLVMFGRQAYGIGREGAMCGALVCGLARRQVTALGTAVVGTTRRGAVGTTVAGIGAKTSSKRTSKAKSFLLNLPFLSGGLSDTIR